MKHIIKDHLDRIDPSRSTLNVCLTLLERNDPEQRAKQSLKTDEEILMSARNSALDTAQALEEAMERARTAAIDHAELLKRTDKLIRRLEAMAKNYDHQSTGINAALDLLHQMKQDHETDRTLRALRQR